MNKLPHSKRVQILSVLCEGSSKRSIIRVVDVSINTVSKILAEAGAACEAFHDETIRNARSKRIHCDRIWAFCYAELPSSLYFNSLKNHRFPQKSTESVAM